MANLLQRLNDGVYRVERWIVVFSSLVMAFLVFGQVVYRRYVSPQSILVEKIGKWSGMDLQGSTYQSLQSNANWLIAPLFFFLVYFGIRSASQRPLIADVPKAEHEEKTPHVKALLWAGGALVGTWLALHVSFGTGKFEDIQACKDLDGFFNRVSAWSWRCGLYPKGVGFSSPVALILTLWLGFVGASMATKDGRHLKVEAVQRALPEKVKRVAALISGLLTAAFCLFLAKLALTYIDDQYQTFVESEELGGMHDGVDIPRYQTFKIVPFAYGVMAVRFIAAGILGLLGKLEDTNAELGDFDFEEAADRTGLISLG